MCKCNMKPCEVSLFLQANPGNCHKHQEVQKTFTKVGLYKKIKFSKNHTKNRLELYN